MVRLSLKMDEFEYLIFVKFQFLKVFSFKMLLNTRKVLRKQGSDILDTIILQQLVYN